MKRSLLKHILICSFSAVMLLTGAVCAAQVEDDSILRSENGTSPRGTILMIASYNPDTRRMSSFISDFENHIEALGLSWEVVVEDMGCKGVDEAPLWKARMTELLERYDKENVKAVILLGQEAWMSFLLQKGWPRDIPFFGCFASENGILLPESSDEMIGWMPESVNTTAMADSVGLAGGSLNRYDLSRNINLIYSLYPNTKHIAFISDNTYGGISLQALVRSESQKYPEIDFIYIDGRDGEKQSTQRITELPPNTVILLGTWRVGANGEYLMYSAMESLLAGNPNLPVFTISGTGMDGIALGGYIPIYSTGAGEITSQIDLFHTENNPNTIYFNVTEGEYHFNQQKLTQFGIERYKLPRGSVVFDSNEAKFRKYRNYVFASLGGLIFLTLIIAVLYIFYYKNKTLTDVLKAREVELIAARDRAQESDRLKSAFLANMSHEIRTPLNAIVGFSSLLLEDGLEQDEKAEYQRIIATNSELMLTLISDILDISRLETSRATFKIEEVDIVQLCQQTILTTAHTRKAGVKCSLQCEYESFTLRTDIKRLTQVMINLLNNANKFTEQGSITVSFRELPGSGLVQFSVTDTGTGIPLEKQARVFERFEKLDEFKQGTGLGLSICKQIVLQLGGDIWVDPGYKNGARFVFTHSIGL